MPDFSEGDIFALIQRKYPSPAYAVFGQVGNTTGSNTSRWADALVMSLYPSRGLDLIGFEIKVSRSDWKHEIKTPKKAEVIQKYCDMWYIVAPPGVVEEDEVPSNWGYYTIKKRALKVVKKAPRLEAEAMSRGILASILRRAEERLDAERKTMVPVDKIKDRLDARYRMGLSDGKKEANRIIYAYNEMKEAVEKFEKASGVRINAYEGEQLGKAVDAILTSGGVCNAMNRLSVVLQDIEKFVEITKDRTEVAIDSIKELGG